MKIWAEKSPVQGSKDRQVRGPTGPNWSEIIENLLAQS